MITLRPAAERGVSRASWLDSRHSFSFAEYHDPRHMGFGALRIINDDRIAPGAGFPPHSHRDMEIVTYVVDGALEHRDSLGTGSVIRPGDVQRMSAGTGITHSEFNHSKVEELRLLQIWILPERTGIEPGYEQRTFAPAELAGAWRLVASPDGRNESVQLHQKVNLHAARFSAGEHSTFDLTTGRSAWLQIVRGDAVLGDLLLHEGDGVALRDESELALRVDSACEALLFELG